ncbi:type II secretion system F family protein [Candidatus Manganitrophus noduliformans]|uniref:Type II secretion system F family protein n=1 Tax=Candidatus Manganitrophus noduliformans TaxID=2606439 RepID=A0A7X6DSS1_9BACT|nr:type II secretion system F family protein [Candidatus Manganitrophus noduliformans]NKE72721.1 type II secretion system F family protein [Candidatus Manganitrophus noduliformans]
MPTFRYKARDKYGALFMGTFETHGKEAVAGHLDSLGYIPVAIEEEKPGISLTELLPQFERISSEDLIIFSRQLATLIGAGIPFMASFNALEEQTENPKLKKVIGQVQKEVEGGSTFADALAKHPKVFSQMYVSMVKAGETGGVLDEVLNRLAMLAEHDAETRARIKAATRYPKIVLIALVVAFVILVSFVIPKFSALYANYNVALPLPTQLMIGLNNIVHRHGLLILAAAIGSFWGFRKYINTPQGRLWWDGFKLKLPVFGPIFTKTALSRFARVFGTLTRSGLPILQTLEIVSETVGNVVIGRVVDNIRDSARQGRGIVQPMKVSKVFPPIVIQMVAVGEESGKMEEMMMKVSEYYDRDVEYAIKNLSSSLEPLLLAVIGVVVVFLALAIFMPWWNLINVFKGGR